VVAFLDETVLNQQVPVFADWIRKPLQQELFGIHVAGEIFFEELQGLLAQSDSAQLAHLLEVFHLCLSLGYRGRYGAAGAGELHGIRELITAKMRRSCPLAGDFSPAWKLPIESLVEQPDLWVRRLFIVFAASVVLTILLFAGYSFSLRSGVSALDASAAQVKR
jgi:type VI secretion system protein ImpK